MPKPCPHYCDNQGLCHKCGVLLNEEWARRYGYTDAEIEELRETERKAVA